MNIQYILEDGVFLSTKEENGQPVATASLFLAADVAGIYFVFTLPLARGQGIGAAITSAALQDARQRGYRIGVLAASSMGHPVYRRLGFREYCRFYLYEWQHAPDRQCRLISLAREFWRVFHKRPKQWISSLHLN